MKKNNQSGFSLIELLVVVVIIGIIAAVALPYLKKAKYASENGAMLATLKTISSAQIDFFTRNSRYATLPELNAAHSNSFGATVDNTIVRGTFTLDMGSVSATDASLRENFTLTATKTLDYDELPYIISVDSTGQIVQITP